MPGAQRFQYGPWSWPLVHAWARAAEYLDEIGINAIWARTESLTLRLKEGIQSIPGTVLYTSRQAAQSAALVSFGLDGWTGEELADILRRRWNMIVKPLPHTREGLRISVPFFLLEEEIDRLVSAVEELGAQK